MDGAVDGAHATFSKGFFDFVAGEDDGLVFSWCV